MAKYQLVEYEIKNEEFVYHPINWTKIPRFNNFDPNRLQDIIEFISSYDGFEEMCIDLWQSRLLENKIYEENKFKIIYHSKGQNKWIDGQFIYKSDKSFLNIDVIIKCILDNYNNLYFLEDLCKRYTDYPQHQTFIRYFERYLDKCKNQEFITQEEIIYLEQELRRFVIRECCQYDKDNYQFKRKSDGSYVILYKKFYDLAIFIIEKVKHPIFKRRYFDPEALRENDKEEFLEVSEFQEVNQFYEDVVWVNTSFNQQSDKVKTKIKKKEQCDHQISLGKYGIY